MLGTILRIILAFIAIRFIGGLVRTLSGGTSRGNLPGDGAPGEIKPPKPMVDRTSAIDVPFTEERKEP